ncbi:hypothetical protein ACFLXY_04895 [Chloroflexota bacterium]
MDEKQEQEYQQMRGEYLSRMASLEFLLTQYLLELLEVQNYHDEFDKWFIETPIPLNNKVSLLKEMMKENTMIETNFPYLWKDFKDLQNLRTTLAHSFSGHFGIQTARGKKISEKKISHKALSQSIERLRKLENIILNLYVDLIEGFIPPISADDFADGPM